jgi:hypothetical protein
VATSSIPGPVPVRRLTFSYEGDRVRLVSEQRVTMILPPSHPPDLLEQQSGFSVVLRDERGAAVYGRMMSNPFQFDREVFDRDPRRSLRREANPDPHGSFVVLVPALADARRLEFFGHPLKPRAHLESPRRLASFMLQAVTEH